MLEVDDPRQVPDWPWVVRRQGRAVAAYLRLDDAITHAASTELVVDYDTWAAQNPQTRERVWQTGRR